MTITAQIRQRPVGQGGLCEGWLSERTGLRFRWVYDCGSNQSQALNREINRIGGPIDLLFLSHLDNDHVNGVDALLATRDTTEVVLPYLNDHETILLVAAAASAGALSGSFLNFAGAPAAWLLGRGVQRVTFIRGGDDGEDPDPMRPGSTNLRLTLSGPRSEGKGCGGTGAHPSPSRRQAPSRRFPPGRRSMSSGLPASPSGRFCPRRTARPSLSWRLFTANL